jgi:hypothetical protein
MSKVELPNTEMLVLIIAQETNLDVQTAGILFDRFQEEHALDDLKMTQSDIRNWLVSQGVEIVSVYPMK